MTFDLSPNHYVPGPGDLISVKLGHIFTKILYSPGFSPYWLLWPWPMTFDSITRFIQQLKQKIWGLLKDNNYDSLHGFLRCGVRKVFVTLRLTHALTHSQTDRPHYSMPLAPFFNGGRGIIMVRTTQWMSKLGSCREKIYYELKIHSTQYWPQESSHLIGHQRGNGSTNFMVSLLVASWSKLNENEPRWHADFSQVG